MIVITRMNGTLLLLLLLLSMMMHPRGRGMIGRGAVVSDAIAAVAPWRCRGRGHHARKVLMRIAHRRGGGGSGGGMGGGMMMLMCSGGGGRVVTVMVPRGGRLRCGILGGHHHRHHHQNLGNIVYEESFQTKVGTSRADTK